MLIAMTIIFRAVRSVTKAVRTLIFGLLSMAKI